MCHGDYRKHLLQRIDNKASIRVTRVLASQPLQGAQFRWVLFRCSSRQVYSEGVDDVRVRGGGGISGHNGISDFSLTSGKGRLMPERQHWLFKSGLKIKNRVT